MYVPGAAYDFTGLIADEVVPSPKDQEAAVGNGEDVFVNVIASSLHAVVCIVNAGLFAPRLIKFCFVIVSVQPVAFLTINRTV